MCVCVCLCAYTYMHVRTYMNTYMCLLCTQIEIQERLPLTNFKGSEVGQLTVEALPCLQDGSIPEDNEVFLEDPTQLIGQPLHFTLSIKQATGLPTRFNKVRTVHALMEVA